MRGFTFQNVIIDGKLIQSLDDIGCYNQYVTDMVFNPDAISSDATIADLKVSGKPIADFNPARRVYKNHRKELYKGYVFPLGERPDDAAWAGFQNYHPGGDFGYLTLFREIDNQERKKGIRLKFLKNEKLLLEDLMTGKKKKYKVDENGFTEFEMIEPASFRFYKYTIL